MHVKSLRRPTQFTLIVAVSAAIAWSLVPDRSRMNAEAGPGTDGAPITLIDVFSEDGVLTDMLTRSYADFEVTGPAPRVLSKFTYFDAGIKGPVFFGYCNPDLTDPCDCHCTDGVDPCTTPGDSPIMYRARQTIEMWIPNNPNFAGTPVLYVDKGTNRDGEAYQEKVLLARTLAKKGIPAALWSEEDLYPVGAEPAKEIHEFFGYPGPAQFQRAALRWMHTRDPMNLTVQDFRFDDRYHNCQSFVLTTTFFQEAIKDFFPGNQAASDWADRVESVYAGGSKTGGGAVTATGVDPRCIGNRISNFQSYDGTDGCAAARYETDWRECPANCPNDDPCTPVPSTEHKWTRHSVWVWNNRNNSPSYFDIYRPDFNPALYEDKLLIDIAGTHDWINTLGGHQNFWSRHDGMIGGLPDPGEDEWDFRTIRRINHDHGTPTIVGTLGGGTEVRADQLMVWGMLRHLAKNKALPRMEIVEADTAGTPGVDPWTARVRVRETRAGHDPLVHESFKVHVALSDDRDFRRCTPPIQCRGIEETPCELNGVCRDAPWDDNKAEEDFFIEIVPTSVTVDGEFRDLVFDPPAEALAVPNPITAVIVEAFFEGGIISKLQDDWVLWTDVLFNNVASYPPHDCCP